MPNTRPTCTAFEARLTGECRPLRVDRRPLGQSSDLDRALGGPRARTDAKYGRLLTRKQLIARSRRVPPGQPLSSAPQMPRPQEIRTRADGGRAPDAGEIPRPRTRPR